MAGMVVKNNTSATNTLNVLNKNAGALQKSLEKVSSGAVTFAARDSELDGQRIKKNEVLALDNGKLSFTEKDVNKAAYKLTKKLVHGDSTNVTLIYGADVSEEKAQQLKEQLQTKFGSRLEILVIRGGQPVYYYLISVE